MMQYENGTAIPKLVERLLVWAVSGALISGAAALVVALGAALSARWEASAIALGAAALAFGFLVKALLER